MKTDARREIIKLALLLDEVSDLQVFIEYSGHVNSLRVRVYSIKEDVVADAEWTDKTNELLFKDFYCDFKYKSDLKNYEEIRGFLQSEIDKRIAI